MTEGIIKDIFKKHVSEYPYPYGVMLTCNVMAIQQELIEEIKKMSQKQYESGVEYPDLISMYLLIGDNQE